MFVSQIPQNIWRGPRPGASARHRLTSYWECRAGRSANPPVFDYFREFTGMEMSELEKSCYAQCGALWPFPPPYYRTIISKRFNHRNVGCRARINNPRMSKCFPTGSSPMCVEKFPGCGVLLGRGQIVTLK